MDYLRIFMTPPQKLKWKSKKIVSHKSKLLSTQSGHILIFPVTTVKIGKEYESEIPDNWDIAIHRYDIKTNEGAAYQTSYTSFDALKANGKLPDDKDFVKDEWTTDKIAIDMSGMMEGNIVYTDSYYNSVLSTWLNVDTSTMPPIYTMSNQVYLIRLKDNTYAAIRFTNYTNAKGIKGYIDFDFLYPFDFEKNN